MGPAAVLEIGTVQVLVASHPTYDWADEQYRSLGMDPDNAKFIVPDPFDRSSVQQLVTQI